MYSQNVKALIILHQYNVLCCVLKTLFCVKQITAQDKRVTQILYLLYLHEYYVVNISNEYPKHVFAEK